MKKEIDIFDHACEIMKAVKKGVLLTTKSGDTVNSMTISWGTLGIEWGKPIFTTFVREHRYTKELLDESMEFTINIPIGDYDTNITHFCGTQSGRNVDKISHLGLTLEQPSVVSAPAIKEFPLTLECRVIYKQEQDKNAIPDDIKKSCYPQNVDSDAPLANKDYHIAYYGEIVKAYIVE